MNAIICAFTDVLLRQGFLLYPGANAIISGFTDIFVRQGFLLYPGTNAAVRRYRMTEQVCFFLDAGE